MAEGDILGVHLRQNDVTALLVWVIPRLTKITCN
jgi:hypothetical protein